MKRYLTLGVIAVLLLAFNSAIQAQSILASGYSFSTNSGSYSYLSGGTSVTGVQVDDGYSTIPIGFTFKFCGVDYTDVTVCSNGWLRFGTGVGTSSPNWNYNTSPNSGIEPAVYVLYEDVSGVGGTSTYTVTGTSPNRIFKWECKDWKWDYAASNASISFQVWLYESGIIECHYQQESGSVSVGTSGGATIGIGNSSTDWQTLNGVGSSPSSSSSTWTYNLSSRPASGQVYQWDPGPFCAVPTGLAINLVNSKHVDFSWNSVGSSQGYEYVIDNNSTPPSATTTSATSVTTTTANESGLTPSTQYYIHLRTKCGATNFSGWATLSFKTLPPCVIPPVIQVPYVDSSKADVQWKAISTALTYEYVVKTNRTPPANAAGAVQTSTNTLHLANLQSGTTYYIFVRAKCQGDDSSEWVADSIYVPIPCHAPVVKFTDVGNYMSVAYWDSVATAYKYEIINSTVPLSDPHTGITLESTSKIFSSLDPGKKYYIYARSYCDDNGIRTLSPWWSTTYSTWALDVNNVEGQDNTMTLYPNPAHDMIQVKVGGDVDAGTVIHITNVAGSVVVTKSVNSNNTQIDISSLPAGLYTVLYRSAQKREQIKFIKQ